LRALRIALAGSALLLCVAVIAVPGTPVGSLGRWGTDHCAHYGASVMFWHHGLAIFDTPMRDLCGARTPEGLAFAAYMEVPDRYVCERPGERPLVINWQAYPRPYPPGALVVAAPEALLYTHTALSVYAVDRIAIVKDILVGHLLVLVLLEMLLAGGDWRRWSIVLVPVVYLGVVPWAAAGFYDPIAVACVCWAIGRLERDRPLDALGLLSLAAFLHFRAIWYVPLGIVTVAKLRVADLRTWRAALAALLLGAAVLALVLVGPYLGDFPHTNPILLTRLKASAARIDYLVLIALVLACLLLQRQWLLATLVAWQGMVIGITAQTQFWHPMWLLPLLAVARWKRARWPTIAALLLLMIGVARIVYKTPPMIASFASDVIHLNL
jgi:hypothetical protein